MPLPKRRHSHSRKNKRRSHFKLYPINYCECPKCHSPRMPHRVCPVCGYYNGKLVVAPKEKEKE